MTLKTSLKQFYSTYRHRCGMGIGAGCISGLGATASVVGGTTDVGDLGDASGCGGCGGCGGYAKNAFLFKQFKMSLI